MNKFVIPMKLPEIAAVQYYAAPIFAPIPTAIAVGATLNHSLSLIPGIADGLALAGGIGGAIATELSGGLMFSMAAKAFLRKDRGVFTLALIGSFVYIGVLSYSVSTTKDAAPIIGATVVVGLSYLAVTLYQYFQERDKKKDEEKADAISEAQRQFDNEIRMIEVRAIEARALAEAERIRNESAANLVRQQKLLVRQERAKIEHVRQGSPEQPEQISEQNEQKPKKLKPEWVEMAKGLLTKKPNATTREVAACLGVKSSSTGKAYKDAAETIIRKEKESYANQ